MVLRTKSILAEPSNEDGIRISVMRKHTLNNGITFDSRINPESYDKWHQDLAPPAQLLGDYHGGKLSWEQYVPEYIKYIRTLRVFEQVGNLAREALQETITILCIEETAEKCHRRLLAEECKRHRPELVLEIA